MSTAIDFGRSSCTWLLKEQPSYGRFWLDAALRIGSEQFLLCAQVFACDVYGTGGLFKSPPYGFAAVFSREHYRIFRDPVNATDACEDSTGRIADRFSELKIDVVRASCRPVEIRDTLDASMLLARIRLPAERGAPSTELEFPVRHINVDRSWRFQAETGPVLVMEGSAGEGVDALRRAYVAFNRLDEAEFLVDSSRQAGRQPWSGRAKLTCEITLFAIGNAARAAGERLGP